MPVLPIIHLPLTLPLPPPQPRNLYTFRPLLFGALRIHVSKVFFPLSIKILLKYFSIRARFPK